VTGVVASVAALLGGVALAGVVGCFPLFALISPVAVVPTGLGVVLSDWWQAYSRRNTLA